MFFDTLITGANNLVWSLPLVGLLLLTGLYFSLRTLFLQVRCIPDMLRQLARGEAYTAEAPGLWDVTFQTAVAQAELDDDGLAGSSNGADRSQADTPQRDAGGSRSDAGSGRGHQDDGGPRRAAR